VVNPEPAEGGEDPEPIERLRQQAPLTVRTLDRAVSLRDYRDFAQAFPGIAKAHALTAQALGSNRLSDRDRALMEAVHTRHAPGGTKDGVHGDLYADTMIALAQRWPDDDLVAILAAEAIMTSQPWDYWEAGGKVPKARAGTALALVDKILARMPDQPLAIHLLIHLTEASANPAKAAGPAARLVRSRLKPRLSAGALTAGPSESLGPPARAPGGLRQRPPGADETHAVAATEYQQHDRQVEKISGPAEHHGRVALGKDFDHRVEQREECAGAHNQGHTEKRMRRTLPCGGRPACAHPGKTPVER
jgi:hypothetical protein